MGSKIIILKTGLYYGPDVKDVKEKIYFFLNLFLHDRLLGADKENFIDPPPRDGLVKQFVFVFSFTPGPS